MPHDIRMDIRIHAPKDRVFEHILLPHHLARWWCSFAQVSPKPGGAFNFGGDYCIVPPEGHAHLIRRALPQTRRTLDIRQEKRVRPWYSLRHVPVWMYHWLPPWIAAILVSARSGVSFGYLAHQ